MPSVVPALAIGKKLGNGHFGEVFLATDSVHGQVAVKVLARKLTDTDDAWRKFKEEFLAEAQHLSQARHRNVVPVYHIEELPDGNSIRFCMAFCPGGSLQSAFEAGPMSLLQVRKVATEIALGLGSLHARGMLHRDIKPGNILIDADGVAQLGDFGLVTDNLILGYASQAGYTDHIAYEVWQGQGTSAKTDIWAMGMTLYRLLHGQAWYEEAVPPKLVIRHGGFADSLRWLPHIPKPWRRVIRKMLNDDPSLRYHTATQVTNALSALPTPHWDVEVTPGVITWRQALAKRTRIVELKRPSGFKHEWSGWSEPLAGSTGNKMTFGGSKGLVNKAKAFKGLDAFFAA